MSNARMLRGQSTKLVPCLGNCFSTASTVRTAGVKMFEEIHYHKLISMLLIQILTFQYLT